MTLKNKPLLITLIYFDCFIILGCDQNIPSSKVTFQVASAHAFIKIKTVSIIKGNISFPISPTEYEQFTAAIRRKEPNRGNLFKSLEMKSTTVTGWAAKLFASSNMGISGTTDPSDKRSSFDHTPLYKTVQGEDIVYYAGTYTIDRVSWIYDMHRRYKGVLKIDCLFPNRNNRLMIDIPFLFDTKPISIYGDELLQPTVYLKGDALGDISDFNGYVNIGGAKGKSATLTNGNSEGNLNEARSAVFFSNNTYKMIPHSATGALTTGDKISDSLAITGIQSTSSVSDYWYRTLFIINVPLQVDAPIAIQYTIKGVYTGRQTN